MMKGLRLYKKEKLCSETAIGILFSRNPDNSSSLSFPLRAVWRNNPSRRSDAPISFLISVPKKRLKHAVDRVAVRRRIREAYRLARPDFPLPADKRIDLAFIYVADKIRPYHNIDRAVRNILAAIVAENSSVTVPADEETVR